jgi:hypothetical protein
MAGLIGFVQNAAMLSVIGVAFIGETLKAEYIFDV